MNTMIRMFQRDVLFLNLFHVKQEFQSVSDKVLRRTPDPAGAARVQEYGAEVVPYKT